LETRQGLISDIAGIDWRMQSPAALNRRTSSQGTWFLSS